MENWWQDSDLQYPHYKWKPSTNWATLVIVKQLLTGAEYQIRTGDKCLEGTCVTTTLIPHLQIICLHSQSEISGPYFFLV